MKFSPGQLEALKLVADGSFYPTIVEEDDGWHARWRPLVAPAATDAGSAAVAGWVDEYVRGAAMTPLSEDAEDQTHLTLHDAWALALRSRTGLVRWDGAECAAFAETLRQWVDLSDRPERGGICFRLETNGPEDLAVSCAVPSGRAALKALGEAVYVWGRLRDLKRTGDRLRVALTRNEAEDFLRRGARALADAGYSVESKVGTAAVTAAAEVLDEPLPEDGVAASATAGVKLVVKVDGKPVTAEEIRFLLEQNSPFVFFRDHWIEVDRAILKEALRALERCKKEKVNPVSFAIGLGAIGRLEIDEAKVQGEIARMLNELRAYGLAETVDPSGPPVPGLAATLRDYQRRGAAWMTALTARGFGALLADDMGLGKTVQTIAWMLSLRARQTDESALPFLVVAPLTLLGNWEHEFAKFAPGLRIYVHQGEHRRLASGFRHICTRSDIVITSYNLLVRDHMFFAGLRWGAMVLDEAQTIKNHDTHTARAVRALRPRYRAALTGTPIENSVEDLWSIEEFLNPGLLGDRAEFEDRFAKPLSFDPTHGAGKRLRRALEPFVLRRLKSDPHIAAELGEKREIKEYCALSAAQRSEYERLLADYRASSRRQGDVFALITALKLVCDGISIGGGKLARLFELLEQIFANGESALVFTQYAKVGAWLKRELDAHFSTDFPFLHGALTAPAREREIRRFSTTGLGEQSDNSPNAFILSLRAGGFGLNLVKATHVIHFDRWWNPAVENQATDRAHRIGQDRTVFVHDFITSGTLEEHIDDILERKETLEGLLKDGEALFSAVQLD